MVDDVVEEPLGGAHRDHYQMAAKLKQYLTKTLRELQKLPVTDLLNQRYDKFRKIGPYLENGVASAN